MTQRADRRELVAATAVAGLVTAAWALDAWWRGALGIPRDDDWSYLRTVFAFADTGTLTLNGWVHMFFLGQALWAKPVIAIFGDHVVALQLAVMAFGVVGLVACHAIVRRLLSVRLAALVLLTLALGPVYGHLVGTFMTDLPTFALMALTILAGLRALEAGSSRACWGWLAVSALAAVAAFSIREYGAVALVPVVVSVGAARRGDRRFRGALVAAFLVLVLALVLAYRWRAGLPNAIVTERLAGGEIVERTARTLLTFALFLVPVLLAVNPVRLWRITWSRSRLVVIGIAVVTLSSLVLSGGQLLGTITHPSGSTWTSVGDGVRMMPIDAYRGLVVIGALFLFVLLMASVTLLMRLRRSSLSEQVASSAGLIGLSVLAIGGAYALAMIVLGSPLFDRYLLVLMPLAGAVILHGAAREGALTRPSLSWLAPVGLAAMLVGSVMFVDTSSLVDGARWRAATAVAQGGIDPSRIDGGDPWFRYHQQGAGSLDNSIPGRTWWTTFFPGSLVCRIIALESEAPLSEGLGERLSTQSERTLTGQEFRLVVLRGPDPCA